MLKHLVEGTSPESYPAAIFDALDNATEFLDGVQGGHVVVKDLSRSDDRIFHAILELSRDPLVLEEDRDLVEVFGEAEEGETGEGDTRAPDIAESAANEGEAIRDIVADHLKKRGIPASVIIPDYLLATLTRADIDNNVIEREFLDVALAGLPPAMPAIPAGTAPAIEPE